MDIASAPAAYLRLAAALALVDLEFPGIHWADRAERAYAYRDAAVAEAEAYDPDEDGSDAYVRHLELRGYDDARFQEQMEAWAGIPV